MKVPGLMQEQDLPGFSGLVWFRKTIDIPAGWAGKDLILNLGVIDDNDFTYFQLSHTITLSCRTSIILLDYHIGAHIKIATQARRSTPAICPITSHELAMSCLLPGITLI